MASNTSFTLKGATPDSPLPTNNIKRLNLNKGLSIGSSGDLYSSNNALGVTVPVSRKPNPLASALDSMSSQQTPAIKKQIVTEYHPPETPAAPVSLQQSTQNQTGLLNQNQKTQSNYNGSVPTYPGLITDAMDKMNKATQYERNVAQTKADIAGNGNYSLDTQVGRQGLVDQTAAIQQSALNQSAKNALTAAGLVAPVTQFGVLTSPVTGAPISGASAGTAAFQGGQIQGQQQLGAQVSQMNAANTAAKGIEGTITQYLQQNPDLNPSDLKFANSFSQWARGEQLTDPKYQTLANYLNEYISTLAPILGVGGDTTNLKTEIAQSMINAKASGKSIAEVLTNLSKLADDKLANIVSAAQGGGQVAGGTPVQGVGGQMFGSFF